jgi:hypothetical protein
MPCPTWPLNLQFIGRDVVATPAGQAPFYIGPPQTNGVRMAWVIFNSAFNFATNGVPTGSQVVLAFLQHNNSHQSRQASGYMDFGSWRIDRQHAFVLIGGCVQTFPLGTGEQQLAGQQRPLYLVYPDEIAIAIPATGLAFDVACFWKNYVLEVPADVDVSAFL